MSNQIEWPTRPNSTSFTVDVPDNWPSPPEGPGEILVASFPAAVNVNFSVEGHGMALGGEFEITAYAESVGPGQEVMLGKIFVPVNPGQRDYAASIQIPPNTLRGEGQQFNGLEVSGIYKIVAVLQHRNPGPTWISGFAETTLRMFLSP